MLQRIILTLILLHFTENVGSQNLYSDSLLYFETEIFHADRDSVDIKKIQKIDYMMKVDSLHGQILNEVRRVNYHALPDSIRIRSLWNASIISYLNDSQDLAFLYWKNYRVISKDTSLESQLLGYITSVKLDSNIHQQLYSTLERTDSLFVKFETALNKSIETKGTNFKKVSAFLIPGSGLIINGNIGKGLISLGLNTGIVLFVRYLIISNAWVNSVLWGSNLIGKFYLGGYRLTVKEIEIKKSNKKRMRAENNAQILNEIFEKYPLKIKLAD